MPNFQIVTNDGPTSAGDPISVKGEAVSNLSITNNTGESIQYSTNSGVTFTTLAAGSSANLGGGTPDQFRFRRANSGAYPLSIDASADVVNSLDTRWTVTSGSAALVDPVSGRLHATLGSNVVTVGVGGQYSTIQAAIDSITDNLPVNHNTGTVSVTNGSAQITFSAAPANDKVVAGRDLFSVDGVRYYRIKNGPTVAGGTVFNLFEVYQGATNAAASYSVYKPNPRTVLLLDPVYDYSSETMARNILLKPYVGLVGISPDGCIIRRNKNNATPDNNPLIGMAHGSWLSNLTLDSVDGHFLFYRMGLTAQATTQTQAMAGSRWRFDRMRLRNADPNGVDAGADYVSEGGGKPYNDDEVLFENCEFEHCWDGFSLAPTGGRLKMKFINPHIIKIPLPLNKQATGAAFIRSGGKLDVEMINLTYDQATFCSDETYANDGSGGALSNAIGYTGVIHVTANGGVTVKVVNPNVRMAVGAAYGRIAPFAIMGGDAATKLTIIGGELEITGAGAAGSEVAGVLQLGQGTTVIHGTRIDAGKDGVKLNNASGIMNLTGGARIKGVTNSAVNTAGTLNKSANVSLVGATSGVVTTAET